MSIIKSFSVNNGDMFYIKHESDNFTIIDCNLIEEKKDDILDEISANGYEIEKLGTNHVSQVYICRTH